MKLNLSLPAKGAQRCASASSKINNSPFAQLVLARTQSAKPPRIALPSLPRLVLRGDRRYLRALRAAEMDAWVAGRPFVVSQFKVG